MSKLAVTNLLNSAGQAAFGQAQTQGHGVNLMPELPATTPDIIGIDLTHTIHTSDFGMVSAKGGAGGGGSGSGGVTPEPYTSSFAGSGFNITIEFKGSWTPDLYQAFVSSADRLSSFIYGDVPNVNVIMKGGVRLVDDILITAELKTIDGAGGILGQAGPTSLRTGSYLPATASMQFDSADAAAYSQQGLFDDIVLHEMTHSLGFGSIWSYKGLVSNSQFMGTQATLAYNALLDQQAGGSAPDAQGVPLETTGGSGTAGSHWLESLFKNELMTGYLNGTPGAFSSLTGASLADLGYGMNPYAQYDPYQLPV